MDPNFYHWKFTEMYECMKSKVTLFFYCITLMSASLFTLKFNLELCSIKLLLVEIVTVAFMYCLHKCKICLTNVIIRNGISCIFFLHYFIQCVKELLF